MLHDSRVNLVQACISSRYCVLHYRSEKQPHHHASVRKQECVQLPRWATRPTMQRPLHPSVQPARRTVRRARASHTTTLWLRANSVSTTLPMLSSTSSAVG